MTQNRTIVLIEDESEQREALKLFLTAEGFDVYSYMSAEEALNNLSSIKPDLFVSDIKLPGMDGITFFHQIKKDARLQSVPFFFISAFNDPQTISSITSLGAVAYITKPYDLDDFLKVIRKNIPSPSF
jgi:two-component system CheB/CheR fusion protein